jgi:hypothetical protein
MFIVILGEVGTTPAAALGKSTGTPGGDTNVDSTMKNINSKNTMSVILDMLKVASTFFLDLTFILSCRFV